MSVSVTKAMWQDQGILWVLNQWGLCLNTPAVHLGFDSHAPFVTTTSSSNILIDDDLVHEINMWINDMKEDRRGEKRLQAQAVEMRHVKRIPFERIAEELHMSRPSLNAIYVQGTSWIDSKVDDYYKLSAAQRRMIKLLMKAS